MKTQMILASLALSIVMIGCGSSSGDSNTGGSTNNNNSGMGTGNNNGNTGNTRSSRFEPMTMNNNIIMQDKTTSLEWINGSGGCHPMAGGKSAQEAFDESEAHCEGLTFAGHTDWRVPTITEAQSFTVGMNDDGIIPFYQNPACPRIIGYNMGKTALQNTNTHNTPPIGTITDWATLNAGVRCVRDGATMSTSRFVPMTMNNNVIMQDMTTNLEWVNGSGGCHPMTSGKTSQEAFTEAEGHCDALTFAGHTDWRVPTIGEIQTFTVDMDMAGITPFYQNPSCPRVVGYDDTNTTLKNTNTHNTPPIGMISDWATLNAGVRCVRMR